MPCSGNVTSLLSFMILYRHIDKLENFTLIHIALLKVVIDPLLQATLIMLPWAICNTITREISERSIISTYNLASYPSVDTVHPVFQFTLPRHLLMSSAQCTNCILVNKSLFTIDEEWWLNAKCSMALYRCSLYLESGEGNYRSKTWHPFY